MNSTWKSLLWKEWREQRWRLVALTGLLSLPALWFFFSITAKTIPPFTIGDYLSIFTAFSSCYFILAGCFLGMHVAGGENSQRTMGFMQALPTPMWQAGLVKLIVSIFVAILPLLLLYGVVSAILPSFVTKETLSEVIERLELHFGHVKNLFEWASFSLTIGVLGVTSLVLWMAAAGVNRSDEVRAGAIGFLVCLAAWLPSLYLHEKAEQANRFLGDRLELLAPILPGGPAFIPHYYQEGTNWSGWFLIISALVFSHGAILAWYLKRFGRVAVPPKRAGEFELNLFRWKSRNTAPMRSPLRAIAWKQLRETGPLAALAVGCILMIAPVIYYINLQQRLQTEFGDILGITTVSAGFFVILVSGIGVFLEDFAPGVNNFWRSQPVNLKQWFTVKYVVGLSVLILALGSLLTPAFWLETSIANDKIYWFFHAAFFATYHVALLFTLSMTSYCLLRQPIYAAVMTFGLFFCGIMSMGWIIPGGSSYLRATIAMILALTIPITIAWLAVKHDWGWKAGR